MVRYLLAIWLVVLLPTCVLSERCSLDAVDVRLHADLLEEIGFKPPARVFSYIKFSRLLVRFGPPKLHPIQINRRGDIRQIRLVPVTIEVSGSVDEKGAKEFFLHELRSRVKKKGGVFSTTPRVFGRATKLLNAQTLRFPATIRTEIDFMGVFEVAENRTPVWLDIKLVPDEQKKDLGIDAEVKAGDSRASSLLGDLINFGTLPLYVLAEIFDIDSLGSSLDIPSIIIEDEADERIEGSLNQAQTYINENFDVESINSFVKGRLALFSHVFRDRIRYTKQTGFSMRVIGLRYVTWTLIRELEVTLRLNKSSVDENSQTWITYGTACQLREIMGSLVRLNEELNGRAVVQHEIKANDNLHDLSVKYLGSAEYVMTIAQYNNLNDPDLLRIGEVLKIPSLATILSARVHVVEPGDTVWNIVGKSDGGHGRLADVISNNTFPSGADSIYPGMIVVLD